MWVELYGWFEYARLYGWVVDGSGCDQVQFYDE